MQKYRFIIIALIVLGSVGFVSIQESFADKKHVGKYVFINEEENLDMSISFAGFTSLGRMKTSWYGAKFHGKTTANGEVFDQLGLTAAHRNLPFGTLLKLTNSNNERSVVVRINDRGPFVKSRDLDISQAAADSLGITSKGVAKIYVDKILIKEQSAVVTNKSL